MRSPLSRGVALLLAFAVATAPLSARASIFGEENGPLTTLVAQGIAELAQVAEAITTAKQQLELARDVYAGVNEFLSFDPQAFLEGQSQQWMAEVPLAADVQGLIVDLSRGLEGGHFDARDLYNRFDAYRDAHRRKEAQRALGGKLEPFDAKSALTLAKEAASVLNNARTRAKLANAAEPSTIADGLFAADAAKVDPQLYSLFIQRRAQAKQAQFQAFKLLSDSMGASPGKAQQLAAMAAGLSAQELARIDDAMGQSLSLQQLQQQRDTTTRATERRETDYLWKDIRRSTESTFAPPQRGDVQWESF